MLLRCRKYFGLQVGSALEGKGLPDLHVDFPHLIVVTVNNRVCENVLRLLRF